MLQSQAENRFWLIAEAVRQFHSTHEELPLHGGLPDMKAESDVYIRLQNIYKAKAREDLDEVMATLGTIDGGDQVDVSEAELFCKNARFIKLVSAPSDANTDMRQLVGKPTTLQR